MRAGSSTNWHVRAARTGADGHKCPRWSRFDATEDHPPRRGLQHARDHQRDILPDAVAALFDDDHRAIVHVADALPRLIADLHDPHLQELAGQRHRFQAVRHFVQVNHVDVLKLRDLVQVEVVRHHAAADRFREQHEALIDPNLLARFRFADTAVVNLQLDFRVILQPLQDVQTATAAVPLHLVRTVGNRLEFVEDEARHDQLRVDDTSIAHIRDSSIDDDASIENEWSVPLHLLGKLDIRDNKPKLILGLKQR